MSPNQGRWRARVAMALALLVVAGLALSACGSYTFIRSLGGRQVHVAVVNPERANLNHPVAMDFVLVFSEKMETEILKLTARQWFEKKAQFRRDYIENEHYLIFEYEFVPGETEPVIEVPYTVSGRSLVLFADYLTPGEHRVRVDPHKDLTITLLERNFAVQLKEPQP